MAGVKEDRGSMKELSPEVIKFLHKQSFVIFTTVDRQGYPHSACKGIVALQRDKVAVLDLYKGQTSVNLQHNDLVSITAIDEHTFTGYCLKGKARVIAGGTMSSETVKAWEERVTSRITQRVLKNIQTEKNQAHHPEALLPEPKYIVEVAVQQVIDLTPHHLKPKRG